MRKIWLTMAVTMVLALALVLPAAASGTGNLSIGFMSRQEVLSGFTRLQVAYRELEAIKAPLEQQLKLQQEEIMVIRRQLESDMGTLSTVRRQDLETQMRNKALALQTRMAENQDSLTVQEKAKVEPLMRVLEEAVKKVAAAHGYNVIEDLGNPVTIWVDPSLDIGKEVLAEINR